MTIQEALTLLRTIIYLWIAVEFWNLSYLYWYGYKKTRGSQIIHSLQIILCILAVFFTFMSFVSVFVIVNQIVRDITIIFLPLILIPLGFAVRKFRRESLTDQSMKLPKKV